MANRAKRLEKELKLIEEERQFRGRFKIEKVQRKQSVEPLLLLLVNAKNKEAFKNHSLKNRLTNIFADMNKLKFGHENLYQNFRQILICPKPVFSHLLAYERLLEVFFKIEVYRSFATWQRPKSRDEAVVFKNLFYHLFVKYRIPLCMDKILERYNLTDYREGEIAIQLLFHMVKGDGLHHFEYFFPFKVNSKINYHFFNAPAQLDLLPAIWWARLISMEVPYSISLKIIHELSELSDELCWYDWLDDLIFFIKRFKNIEHKDLKRIMEFYISQKAENIDLCIPGIKDTVEVLPLYPDFKLKGRSVASALRFCEEWKNYIQLIKAIGKGADFKPSKFQPFRTCHGKTIVVIKQIRNIQALVREGKQMNHCVASYAGECASGESSIWTMKLYPLKGKMKKALTIEVLEKSGKVNEALGKFNRSPSKLEEQWLAAWTEREGITNLSDV